MKVEIWSDVVCPFCYIGKRRFEEALKQFEHRSEVEKVYRSFQLDPTADKNPTEDVHTILAKKYNMPYEEAKRMNQQVTDQASEVGLEFNFDIAVHANTFDAHRLSHFAAQHGKMYELMERLMQAYFTEGKNVSDFDVLVNLAEKVGLPKEDTLKVLNSNDFAENVRDDISQSQQIGVRGVPFFVFNRKYAVSGAQPTEVFLEVLNRVYEEEKEEPQLQVLNEKKSNTEYCDDDSCGC